MFREREEKDADSPPPDSLILALYSLLSSVSTSYSRSLQFSPEPAIKYLTQMKLLQENDSLNGVFQDRALHHYLLIK